MKMEDANVVLEIILWGVAILVPIFLAYYFPEGLLGVIFFSVFFLRHWKFVFCLILSLVLYVCLHWKRIKKLLVLYDDYNRLVNEE